MFRIRVAAIVSGSVSCLSRFVYGLGLISTTDGSGNTRAGAVRLQLQRITSTNAWTCTSVEPMNTLTVGVSFVVLLSTAFSGWMLLRPRLQALVRASWSYKLLTVGGAALLGLVGLIVPLSVAGFEGIIIAPLGALVGIEIAVGIVLYQLWVSGQYARLVQELTHRKRR